MPDQTPKPAPHFADAAGRAWPIVLTIGTFRRLRDGGVNLQAAIETPEKLAEAVGDPFRFAQTLALLCEPEKRDVTPEQFAEALDGPAIEAAAVALLEAVLFFSQPSTADAATTALHREIYRRQIATRKRWATLSTSGADSPAASESPPTPTPSAS